MATPSLYVLAESDLVDSAIMPLRTGELIGGKYRVGRLIARGGMGLVFEGVHVLLEARVAIKVIRPEVASGVTIERFAEEAKIAARLRSPHVARVLDTGSLPSGIPYLVMEHLEGEDLYERLRRTGPLEVALAVDYVLQACEGLAEAHAAGLVHRDLKPENLFVTRAPAGDEVVKILDFGISKQPARCGRRSYTEPGVGIGSPHYMAPEQMRAPHMVDARADIWTLGIVLYELLAGRTPFDADTIPAVCALVLGNAPPPLRALRPDLPPALEEIVLRCLDKDHARRPSDVGELATALAPFGTPSSALRADRARRIAGVDADLGERVSEAPLQLTRRRMTVASARRWHAVGAGLSALVLTVLVGVGTVKAALHLGGGLPESDWTLEPVQRVRDVVAHARTGAMLVSEPETERQEPRRARWRASWRKSVFQPTSVTEQTSTPDTSVNEFGPPAP